MKKTTAQKAATYRLPETTTPENLEMKLMNNLGTILTFGDHILAAGYFYDPNGRSYYGAVYRFTTGDHTCEAIRSWRFSLKKDYPDYKQLPV